MKLTLCAFILLGSVSVFAKEVKDFNKVLIENVQKDLRTENAEDLKVRPAPSRGPASVGPQPSGPFKDESKIDKNVRQLGTNKW